VYGTYLIRDSA
jgi:hypothetical protein